MRVAILGSGEPLGLREMTKADLPYVMSSWLGQYGWAFPKRERIQHVIRERQRIERLMRKARVVIACAPEHPSVVHGWACVTGSTLEFAYVPIELRRAGICKAMLSYVFEQYPDKIEVNRRWPFASARFAFRERSAA